MSQQGAALQNFNNELVKCIEELCVRRDDLQKQIIEEEEEKTKLQNDLTLLTDKLSKVNESLCRKMTSRSEFDKTILETEAAYTKILESSQTLLTVLKKDTLAATSSSGGRYPSYGTGSSSYRTAGSSAAAQHSNVGRNNPNTTS